jgi:glycosyltransferase involved in cell wall biosynthesis
MSKVSIVIPTYKRPSLIVKAIMSCLTQTVAPYEIIIGDDSPNNETAVVVAQLATTSSIPIRYHHNVPSLGQALNVNSLFDAVSGDEVMLLHDDDLLLPESLETLTKIFANDPSVDIAYGRQYLIDDDGQIDPVSSVTFNTDFYRDSEYEGTVLTPLEASLSQQLPNNGYLMRAHIVRQVQLRPQAGVGCDFDFGYQLGMAGYKMFFVNKYLGMYRLSAQSISHSKKCDMAYQSFVIIRDCAVETPRAQKIRARRLYERAPIAITECVTIGKKKEAFSIFFSKWYRHKTLSIGGLKRLLYIIFYLDLNLGNTAKN